MLPGLRAIPMAAQNWIQLFLATPVQLWAGWPFVRGSWIALRRRTADMNLLVGVGTLTAYLYSLVATVVPAASVFSITNACSSLRSPNPVEFP